MTILLATLEIPAMARNRFNFLSELPRSRIAINTCQKAAEGEGA